MSVWATNENNDPLKHNKKLLLVQNGTQLGNVVTTTEGQLIFSTIGTSNFPLNKLRSRLAGNSAWSGILTESAEQSNTPVADNAIENVANVRHYVFITLPTAEKFYVITGIEWKNSTTIAGNVTAGVDIIDANPPAINSSLLAAFSQEVAQAGSNSIQRVSIQRSLSIRGGTICGIWHNSNNATGQFRTLTTGSAVHNKNVTYSASPPMANNAAWVNDTREYYLKAYYRGYS